MRTYHLRLMGPPGLFICTETSEPSEVEITPASLSILALLGLPGRRGGTARASLAEIMSPECDSAKSSSRLSSAICRLRMALGDHASEVLKASSGNQALALRRRVSTDVEAVIAASDALIAEPSNEAIARLEAAVEARSGEMLDGIRGDWAKEARDELLAIYERALEQLMAAYRDAGEVDHSISTARLLIREDPYREDIHAVLLELYGRKGMRGRAVSHYETTRVLLSEELGVSPGLTLRTGLRAAMADGVDGGLHDDDVRAKLVQIDRNMRRIATKIDQLLETRSANDSVEESIR